MIEKFKQQATKLDEQDGLRSFRNEFIGPAGITYLVGHSLGLRSKSSKRLSAEVERQWEEFAVESWFDPESSETVGPWLEIERKTQELLASFLGARPADVTVMNGLGVNLQLLLHTLYRPSGNKRKLANFFFNFPTDRWLVTAHLSLPGHSVDDLLWVKPRAGEKLVRDEDIVSLLQTKGDEIALFLMPSVCYLTGQAYNLEAIASAANKAGVVLIVDVAHSAFMRPHEMHRWGVDAAVGCSYKFGCGGPGGIGLFFIHEKHWSNPKTWRPGGWWGNDRSTQFLMGPNFEPAKGAAGWQVSTIPILTAAPFLGVLETFTRAGLSQIREKALSQIGFLYDALESMKATLPAFEILTPRNSTAQAAELNIEFTDGKYAQALKERLRKNGVLVDFRVSPFSPGAGVIRVGMNPLYNSYLDLVNFLAGLTAST